MSGERRVSEWVVDIVVQVGGGGGGVVSVDVKKGVGAFDVTSECGSCSWWQ